MGIVGYHHGDAQFLAEVGKPGVNGWQLLHMLVPLQLQEVTLAEQFPVTDDLLAGLLQVAVGNQTGNFRRSATGQANKALVVFFQEFPVNSGAVMKPLNVPEGNQLHQVPVAGIVPGQQHQVKGAALGGVAVVAAVVGNVNLTADNRLDASFLALGIEVYRAVKVAVVGDGQGLHPHIAHLIYQVGNAADAIQHTVFGMTVQVCEQRGLASHRRQGM